MTLTPGTRLGTFEIIAPLGVGGMGEVYHARDGKLGREVAVKVIRADLAGDPDRLDRLEREARVLASLNHLHIATLYGLDQVGEQPFLVMELVVGQTLADLLAGGRLPLAETLSIASQIAAALEAANERGVIHRDLKPGNVKVTPDGQVKVLDFGLAKALETKPPAASDPSEPTRTFHETREGEVVGTPAYMSPEQIRGKPLDRRTDIWSFGCVLYESLTGRQPFTGETVSDVMAAVLEREPDLQALAASIPVRIRELVGRCLRKDPRQRLRDIGDARIEIEETLHEALGRGSTASAREQWLSRRAALIALGAAGVGAAAFVAGRWSVSEPSPPAAPGSPSPASDQTTHWSGELLLTDGARAFLPRVSPDGQWLAFIAVIKGQAQVGLMKLGSGRWKALTEKSDGGLVNAIGWSPDGTEVYYDRVFEGDERIFRIAVVGGEERLVLENASNPHVLGDGSLLVTRTDAAREVRLHRYRPDQNRLELLGPPIVSQANWTPPYRAFLDGKEAVLWVRPTGETTPAKGGALQLLDLATGTTRPLAHPGPAPSGAFYTDEKGPLAADPHGRLVYAGHRTGDLEHIIALPRSGDGSPRRLFALTGRVFGLDVGPDGSVFLDHGQFVWEVLRFSAAGGNPERLAAVSRMRSGPAFQLTDGRILFLGSVAGQERLLVTLPGKEAVPFVETTAETTGPIALLGGTQVAFRAGGKLSIAAIATGRITRRLEHSPDQPLDALTASPDGKRLFYVLSGNVWSLLTDDTQPPAKLHPGDGVAVDPRSQSLVIQLNEAQGSRLVRVSFDGGKADAIPFASELRLAADRLGPHAVGMDGRILVPVASKDSWYWSPAILDPATGKVERIPLDYEGDVVPSGWTEGGKVLARGIPLKTEIWRFRPAK